MNTHNYARYPSLVGRTVFITGGADGIGRAAVRNFARQGSKVAFVDKNVEYAHGAIEECVARGGTADECAGAGDALLAQARPRAVSSRR